MRSHYAVLTNNHYATRECRRHSSLQITHAENIPGARPLVNGSATYAMYQCDLWSTNICPIT